MKPIRILLPLFLLCMTSPASAIVLRALVTEVRDGRSVVVINGNRKLTVVLAGVDAPELLQEYGDVARQHLASLILDKQVGVEFTELKPVNVVGKVVCNNTDVGLQVIRDGVAWYDRSNDHDLTDAERRIYSEAEQAARSEQRGIWHDGSPMPPWEWRRAQLVKNMGPWTPGSRNSNARSLTTEDLLFTRKSSKAGNSTGRVGSAKPSAKPLNRIGEDYDFRGYLTQGRISIVYFYADWCPTCRQLGPVMDAINAQVPDMQVLFLNIGDWNTPITRQYGITFVPYLKIYDKSGNLVAEGDAARAWLQHAFRERA